jgi:hypothetical protein
VSVPKQIAAGATLLFTETINGYPATLYTLAFILNLDGALVATIAGSASGNDFIITAPATTTAAWKPGRYNFAEMLTEIADTTNVNIGCSGQLSVTPNFSVNATPTDLQNQLAAIEATISKVISSPNASVNFNGQSYSKFNLKELFDIRDRLQARVDAELRSLGLSTKGGAKRLVTQFTP